MKKIIFIILLVLCLIPKHFVSALELVPNSKSALLMEVSTGKILYEKNKDDEFPIASMTKMVGLIIIMEKIENGELKYDDIVVASSNASGMGGSQIYLSTGEKMSVRDLIRGITMASANDAIVAIAEHISGTEEKFVELMNKKVKSLGLKHTNFKNCTGLDEDGHYSSSYDMAMIAKELIKHKEILEFTKVYEGYLRESTSNKFWLVNTNKLVNMYDGVDGLKTGFTDNAGYCISATAKRSNMRLIAIVLGENDSKERNKETMELLDYGFNNYTLVSIGKKDECIDKIIFDKKNNKKIDVCLKDDFNIVKEKSDNTEYDKKIELYDNKLPIKKNSVIGNYVVYSNKIKVDQVSLYIKEDIKEKRFIESLFDVFLSILLVY